MRIMYDSTTPYLIPYEADIIAYYPSKYGVYGERHQGQMVVLIDDTGEQAEACHILDLTAESARNVNGLEWVTRWYIAHRNGMSCMNGWIQRPVIKVMAPAARAIRVACMPYDIDVWAVDTSEGDLPVPGCFARQSMTGGQGSEWYGVSHVYNDEWGKDIPPSLMRQGPEPMIHDLHGWCVTVYGDGTEDCFKITSPDGGDTWRRLQPGA